MRFGAKTQIIISRDLTRGIMNVISEIHPYRIGVIIDKNIFNNEIKNFIDYIRKSYKVGYYDLRAKEPTTEFVDSFVEFHPGFENALDLIIGIGGGSTMDFTKAISAMLVNPGSVEDYHMKDVPITNKIPTVMVPTTAGTGAEVTPGAVLINEDMNKKRALNVGSPDYAILCAPLTISMSDEVTFETGVDALAHAIESYTAKNSTPISRMYSMEAFKLLFTNLPTVMRNPENVNARENMLIGANLAGTAIYNSNTGAAHALSYPLGIYHDVPHAQAVTALLPHVVKFNAKHGCTAYADLYDVIKTDSIDESKVDAFVELIDSLIDNGTRGTPMYWARKKRKPVVTGRTYEFLAEKGMDLTGAIENNPVPFNIEDAKYIMGCLMGVI